MLVQPDLGSVGRETPVPLQTARSGPDALQALELESPKAVYSTVVLAGLVTASEWLAITLAGAIPYAAYVVPRIGHHPLYLAIACFGATAATLAFHAQRLYATPAFRRPLGALVRMAGSMDSPGALPHGGAVRPQGRGLPVPHVAGRVVRSERRASSCGAARPRPLRRGACPRGTSSAPRGRGGRRRPRRGGAAGPEDRRPCGASDSRRLRRSRRGRARPSLSKASRSSERSTISSLSPDARGSMSSFSRCR